MDIFELIEDFNERLEAIVQSCIEKFFEWKSHQQESPIEA